MIFNFAVRYLRGLAVIPVLPQMFDAWLLAWTALFRRKTFAAIEVFRERALKISGIEPSTHRFGGMGFRFRGFEIAHLHSNGLFDVELTREVADDLVKSGTAQPHHVFGRSRWVSFWIRNQADVANALALVELAMAVASEDRTSSPP